MSDQKKQADEIALSTSQGLDPLAEVKELLSGCSRIPHILLVDDDPGFGRIMVKFAERLGIKLTYFSTTRDLQKANWSQFDILMIDYDLQNLSGIQLLQAIREKSNGIPAVLVSSYKKPVVPPWSTGILEVIHKSTGPKSIFLKTLEAYRNQNQEAAFPVRVVKEAI